MTKLSISVRIFGRFGRKLEGLGGGVLGVVFKFLGSVDYPYYQGRGGGMTGRWDMESEYLDTVVALPGTNNTYFICNCHCTLYLPHLTHYPIASIYAHSIDGSYPFYVTTDLG